MIDFLCIGAQKAGTTWLMSNLSKHPNVWTPRFIKELHYFDKVHLNYNHDMLKAYKKRGIRCIEKDPNFAAYFNKVIDPDFAFTDAWYNYVFSVAPSSKKKGECTPLYCALPEDGIRHVHRLASNAAIIYMIRDPFERAMSSLRMQMGAKNIKNASHMMNTLNSPLFASRGRYSENIEKWERIFGSDRMLYIPFGDVKSCPDQVMNAVESHLGISAFNAYPRLADKINKTNRDGLIMTDEVIQMIHQLVSKENEYLESRFGSEFLARTK